MFVLEAECDVWFASLRQGTREDDEVVYEDLVEEDAQVCEPDSL